MPVNMTLKEFYELDTNVKSESSSSTFRLIRPKTPIGLEFEIENIQEYMRDIEFTRDLDGLKYWTTHHEGSIRNAGLEFVTRSGVQDKDILAALLELKKLLKKSKTAEFSDRCSLHAHFDMSIMTFNNLKNFILLTLIFEDLLFKFASTTRKYSNYCTPHSFGQYHTYLKKLVTIDSFADLHLFTTSYGDKYSSINLVPLGRFGTIEIRNHPGTFNFSNVILWINIISSIRDYCLRKPLDLGGFYRAPIQVTQEIFDDPAFTKFVQYFGEKAFTSKIQDKIAEIKLLQRYPRAQRKAAPEDRVLNILTNIFNTKSGDA